MKLAARYVVAIAFDTMNAARYLTYELAIKPIGRALDSAMATFGGDDE